MKQKRARYTAEVKRRAVERVAQGEDVSAVASAVGVDRRRVYEWQDLVRQGGVEALRGPGRPRKGALEGPPLKSAILNEGAAARRRIAELERKIGEQQADLDFFRQALRHVKARQQAGGKPGALRSGKSSRR
ncbi:MAG: helix-turn-helix domain-containing protein [Reyranella sp.]|nr:helix-turn-helix domain-containing protein [Reyranella sp.]